MPPYIVCKYLPTCLGVLTFSRMELVEADSERGIHVTRTSGQHLSFCQQHYGEKVDTVFLESGVLHRFTTLSLLRPVLPSTPIRFMMVNAPPIALSSFNSTTRDLRTSDGRNSAHAWRLFASVQPSGGGANPGHLGSNLVRTSHLRWISARHRGRVMMGASKRVHR